MKSGVAKVFETGAKLKKWLMVVLVQPRPKAQDYFHKLKGNYVVQVGVAKATLCHTLAGYTTGTAHYTLQTKVPNGPFLVADHNTMERPIVHKF